MPRQLTEEQMKLAKTYTKPRKEGLYWDPNRKLFMQTEQETKISRRTKKIKRIDTQLTHYNEAGTRISQKRIIERRTRLGKTKVTTFKRNFDEEVRIIRTERIPLKGKTRIKRHPVRKAWRKGASLLRRHKPR